MAALVNGEKTHALLGACSEAYKEKGCGFLAAAFQECLELELSDRGIPSEAQRPLRLHHKGRELRQTYQPDFLCLGKVMVEIKAVTAVTDEHCAQLHNYLKATGLRLGLLINFGHFPLLEHERIVR